MRVESCWIGTSVSFLLNCCSLVTANESVYNESVLYENNSAKIVQPECPLAPGSVQIVPKNGMKDFTHWQGADNPEVYDLTQRLLQIWEKQGITNYFIFGKNVEDPDKTFNWEVVPYPSQGSKCFRQFSVLKNIIFGSACLTHEEQIQVAKDFQYNKESFSTIQRNQIENIEKIVHGNDAFCNPEVIERQRIWEGKEVNVLYNYAPIALSDEKLHFLIMPKMHREKFSDLTPAEYVEAMEFAQKLVKHYQSKGIKIAYLFNSNGEEAGQTVPHWHLHVVFAATKAQELFSKLYVLKKMIFGSSPMPKDEFNTKMQDLRQEL